MQTSARSFRIVSSNELDVQSQSVDGVLLSPCGIDRAPPRQDLLLPGRAQVDADNIPPVRLPVHPQLDVDDAKASVTCTLHGGNASAGGSVQTFAVSNDRRYTSLQETERARSCATRPTEQLCDSRSGSLA
jgi:hypothetical protein